MQILEPIIPFSSLARIKIRNIIVFNIGELNRPDKNVKLKVYSNGIKPVRFFDRNFVPLNGSCPIRL